MLEIEQLEREWRRYKIRKLRPYLIGAAAVAVAGAAYLFLPHVSIPAVPSPQKSEPKSVPPVQVRVASATPDTVTAPPSATVGRASSQPAARPKTAAVPKTRVDERTVPPRKEEKEIFLAPDTAFLSSFAERRPSVQRPVREEIIRTRSTPSSKTGNRQASGTFSKKQKRQQTKPSEERPTQTARIAPERMEKEKDSGKLLISTKQTNNTLEYLIERFNQTRDPKLASYIAQSFYKKGNYKETVRWAILANSIDPSAEESWMLFAKAKVKLGQRQDAIKALRIYLNQYSSRKVKSYLQSLEDGL